MMRATAAYLVLVDPQLAMPQLSSSLTVWQRQQVTRGAVGTALASLDDEAVVRLVEHGMLRHCERPQRRSVAQSVAVSCTDSRALTAEVSRDFESNVK